MFMMIFYISRVTDLTYAKSAPGLPQGVVLFFSPWEFFSENLLKKNSFIQHIVLRARLNPIYLVQPLISIRDWIERI